jgi:hypothetical protein
MAFAGWIRDAGFILMLMLTRRRGTASSREKGRAVDLVREMVGQDYAIVKSRLMSVSAAIVPQLQRPR